MKISISNSGIRFLRIGLFLGTTLWPGLSLAMDCRLGADYYERAKFETDSRQVVALLNKSVQVCPNFNAWYMLGLIHRQQGRFDPALDSFSQARNQAASSKTEALALARRGELLAFTGQLPRALHDLKLARRFHPEPVPQWLEDSLKIARIETHQTLISAADISYIFENGMQTSLDGRFAVQPAVNLPVHFEFDRATINSAGSRQVLELGRALTRPQLNQRSFLIVGHTDKRGSAAYNQALSEKRAVSVKAALERDFPPLAGRLETRGRGEAKLLYDGDSEVDHQLNRRVKVMIEY